MLRSIGGAIRVSGGGTPYLINDEGHESHGLVSIAKTNEGWSWTVEFAQFFEKIITAWVVPDETLILSGVTGGPSVGLGSMTIRLAQNGTPLHGSASVLRNPSANLWVGVLGLVADETTG